MRQTSPHTDFQFYYDFVQDSFRVTFWEHERAMCKKFFFLGLKREGKVPNRNGIQ